MQLKALCEGSPLRVGKTIKRLLLIMKLTVILLFVAAMHVSARGYSQRVSIQLRDAPLEKVFDEIKRQTGYSIFYNYRLLNNARPVTVNVKNASVEEVLNICLKDQPLGYAIAEKSIVITSKELPEKKLELPPPLDVKGRIVNEKNEPVAGAGVEVKGERTGTFTDDQGYFELKGIDENAVLIITGVNIETIEWKVNKRTDLGTIRAKTKVDENEPVVVSTGYQNITPERFVGSYSQLDSANFHRRTGMNIIDRLDGTVTGIFFDKKSSGINFPIQVRGISTLGNNNTRTAPLIVVDNFPMADGFDVNTLNPNDIESVTVLKDAAAMSIWGTRAGNGVIVITTKRGKYNQSFRISVSSNVTIEEKPDLYYISRITASDFIDVEQFLFDKGFYDANVNNTTTRPEISPVVEILARKKLGLITEQEAADQINALRKVDIRDEMDKYLYRQSIRQQHHVSLTGGTSSLAYQLSAGFNRSLNNIQGSKPDNQFTLKSTTSFKPVKNLEVSVGLDLVWGVVKSYNYSFPKTPSPYARLADENGKALPIDWQFRQGYKDTAGAGILLDWNYRPLDEIRFADITNISKLTRLNIGAGYQLTPWLKADIIYQHLSNTLSYRDHKSLEMYETRNLINFYTNPRETDVNLRYPVPIGGIVDIFNTHYQNHNVRGALHFNKSFSGDHQLSALFSSEISDSKGGFSDGQRIYGYDDETGSSKKNIDYFNRYPLTYAVNPNSAATIPYQTRYAELNVNRFVSVMANAAYTYKGRYNIYGSARRDGANIFGVNTNNRWKPLWSVGTSWDISKEKFYNIKWLPQLKFRGSFGYTGNVNNTLSGVFTINYSNSPHNFTSLPFSYAGRAPNPDLRWEEVRIVNLGLDFQMLNKRIAGTFEVFHKRSRDVISNLPMPPASGTNTFVLNAAGLKATGFDLALHTKNITGVVKWTTSAGVSYVKTIVTDVYRPSGGYTAQDFISYDLNATAGQIAYAMASYRWAGLDPMTGDPLGYLNGQPSKNYNAIFDDSVQNQVFHGSSLPLYSAFIRNNLSWKGFTLSLNITGRFNYYFREPALNLEYSAQLHSSNYLATYHRRWQKSGDEAFTNVPSLLYPIPSAVAQRSSFYQYAEIHVKRADNIRVQDIRLSWQLDRKVWKNLPFQTMQVFFYPNNLNIILWRADNSDYDPDFSGGIGSGTLGPSPRTWTAGINVNF